MRYLFFSVVFILLAICWGNKNPFEKRHPRLNNIEVYERMKMSLPSWAELHKYQFDIWGNPATCSDILMTVGTTRPDTAEAVLQKVKINYQRIFHETTCYVHLKAKTKYDNDKFHFWRFIGVIKIFGFDSEFPLAKNILYVDEDTLLTRGDISINDLSERYLLPTGNSTERPFIAVMADGTCYEKLLLINSGVILMRKDFFNVELCFVLLSGKNDITKDARETGRFVGGGASDQAALIALLHDIGAIDGDYLLRKCELARMQQLDTWRQNIIRKFTFPSAYRMTLALYATLGHHLLNVNRSFNKHNAFVRPYLRIQVMASIINAAKSQHKITEAVLLLLEVRYLLENNKTDYNSEINSNEIENLTERIKKIESEISRFNTKETNQVFDLMKPSFEDYKKRIKAEWPFLSSLKRIIKHIRTDKNATDIISFTDDQFDYFENKMRFLAKNLPYSKSKRYPGAKTSVLSDNSTLFVSQPYTNFELKEAGLFLQFLNNYEQINFTPVGGTDYSEMRQSACSADHFLSTIKTVSNSVNIQSPPPLFLLPLSARVLGSPSLLALHDQLSILLLPHLTLLRSLLCAIADTEEPLINKISNYIQKHSMRCSFVPLEHPTATASPILHRSSVAVVLRGSEINATFRTIRSIEMTSSSWQPNHSFLAHYPGSGQWWRKMGSRYLIEFHRQRLNKNHVSVRLYEGMDVDEVAAQRVDYGRHTGNHRHFVESAVAMYIGNIADRFVYPFGPTRTDFKNMWIEGMKIGTNMAIDSSFKSYSVPPGLKNEEGDDLNGRIEGQTQDNDSIRAHLSRWMLPYLFK